MRSAPATPPTSTSTGITTREQQLLAVAQQQPGLHQRLGRDLAGDAARRPGSGGRGRAASDRAPRPVQLEEDVLAARRTAAVGELAGVR